MTILKCSNLHKNFGQKEILKDVSLEIDEGDILAFIGPNGSGKTTTIKLILGLQGITSGKVEINGYDIEHEFVEAIRDVGAIVENPDLYMYLTGYENLKLVANMYKDVTKERIDEVIKLVKLENRIHDKVNKYSLGMRQRLGIAQAIIHHPNLLILDEPTNGLDPEGIKELRDLLKDLANKEHMGIFISSHNLAELETFCNKVCIIKNGKIIETTTVKEMKKSSIDTYYIFKVNDAKKAAKILNDKAEIIKDTKLKVKADEVTVSKIVKKLVEGNIDIYSVYLERISLEDAFLKKTGGNIID